MVGLKVRREESAAFLTGFLWTAHVSFKEYPIQLALYVICSFFLAGIL